MISDGGGVLFFKGFGVFVCLKDLQCVFEVFEHLGVIFEHFFSGFEGGGLSCLRGGKFKSTWLRSSMVSLTAGGR
ncbi:hypothetical protein [Bartonella taylorii]|uniref:Uncharacterized protein n=1 Tax=Bartonella taylorii TaxID=33046 RepID=A0A9Q8YWA4_BARTA|nr:hypothetical protein [Bartonella taylorii]USP02248.1 hypothetical protein LAJ60_05025 [Bartonella taylorii]